MCEQSSEASRVLGEASYLATLTKIEIKILLEVEECHRKNFMNLFPN
jgi:hypothetical protein